MGSDIDRETILFSVYVYQTHIVFSVYRTDFSTDTVYILRKKYLYIC